MRQALELALEALENNSQTHHYCEDTWYSCPKHEDGCANELEGDECNCGADEINAQFDKAIIAIKEALAQPEQEPVAFDVQKALRRAYHLGQSYWADADSESYAANKRSDKHRQNFDELCEEALAYTTPPQRKPLTDEQIAEMWLEILGSTPPSGIHEDGLQPWRFARAIEAAHGIKE